MSDAEIDAQIVTLEAAIEVLRGLKRTRAPGRDKLRGRDVPAVAGPDHEAAAIGDASDVVHGKPVAAGKDFNDATPQRERPPRETCSRPIGCYHGRPP